MAGLGLLDPISNLGIALWLLIIIMIWELVWKFLAMWRAAKNDSIAWFIILGVVNTVGILPILYLFIFSKMGKGKRRKR